MSSYSNILLPTMNNRDRFIVLIDAVPNLGPLGASFFQVSLRRRTVNGFTSNDPVFIVNFLATLGQRLASITNKLTMGSLSGVRASTVVLDRRGSGSVVTVKDLNYWASQVYFDLMARKAREGWTYQQRDSAAGVSRRAAELAAKKIPYQYKPRPKLILGEEPMMTLARDPNIGRWFLGNPAGLDNQIYNTQSYYAQANLTNDPTVPENLRRNAWRIEGNILESIERVLPAFEKLKLSQLAQRGGAGQSIGAALLGAQYRLSAEIAKMMDDRYNTTRFIEYVVNNRVNFMSPDDLDSAILMAMDKIIGNAWERVNMRNTPAPEPAPASMWKRMRMNTAMFMTAAPRTAGQPVSGGEAVPLH